MVLYCLAETLDQDLFENLRYDFGKQNSTLRSVVPLAMLFRIEGSLVPYKSEEEVNIGEDYDGMTAIEEEEEKEERHKYNYFSGAVPIYRFTFLQLIVTLARISLSIF